MAKIPFKKKIERITNKILPQKMEGLDRFRSFYFNDIELTNDEQKTLSNLRKAHSIFCASASKIQTVKILSKELDISEAHSYSILRNAIKLFGDVSKTETQGLKAAKYEYYMMLSNMARAEKDFQSSIKASALADKIMGLFDPETPKIPSSILLPATTFIFVNDPEVLKKQQTEDTDYELELEP